MIKDIMYISIISIILTINLFSSNRETDLTEKDAALITEANHIYALLGNQIWKDWNSKNIPLLIKKKEYDYLLNHPAPPNDFKSYYSETLNKEVWMRKNSDTLNYQATFDINKINTVVMSIPESDLSPCLWTLKTVHEYFHIYQNSIRPKNPFQLQYSQYNSLNFPFNYQDTLLQSWGQIEANYIYQMISKNKLTKTDTVDIKRFFEYAKILSKDIYKDSLQYYYKLQQEWSEGVARYTEREIAFLAAQKKYKPSKNFLKFYNNDYKEIWESNYGQNQIFNPLRFVYEGVKGRVIFYYSGLAKAYLLDRSQPNWKTNYLNFDLDQLLMQNNNEIKCIE